MPISMTTNSSAQSVSELIACLKVGRAREFPIRKFCGAGSNASTRSTHFFAGYERSWAHARPAFARWLRRGGPTGQIAIMQTELVEKKRWISQSRFLHALNFCMLLPGPEAQQLAIYIGWLLHKTRGGIVAGAFFVIPSIFVLWTLSYIYAAFGNVPWIAAIFYGLKPAVTAIVLVAVIRIGRKALKNAVMWSLAAVAFVAIYFFKAPFPAIVLGAGIVGFVGGLFWKSKFESAASHVTDDTLSVISDEQESPPHTKPSLPRAVVISV